MIEENLKAVKFITADSGLPRSFPIRQKQIPSANLIAPESVHAGESR
jgi:hypothetical protein